MKKDFLNYSITKQRNQEDNSDKGDKLENQTGYLINRIEALEKALDLLKSFVKKIEQKKTIKLYQFSLKI